MPSNISKTTEEVRDRTVRHIFTSGKSATLVAEELEIGVPVGEEIPAEEQSLELSGRKGHRETDGVGSTDGIGNLSGVFSLTTELEMYVIVGGVWDRIRNNYTFDLVPGNYYLQVRKYGDQTTTDYSLMRFQD